jgi:hypothetical protein
MSDRYKNMRCWGNDRNCLGDVTRAVPAGEINPITGSGSGMIGYCETHYQQIYGNSKDSQTPFDDFDPNYEFNSWRLVETDGAFVWTNQSSDPTIDDRFEDELRLVRANKKGDNPYILTKTSQTGLYDF